jgi:glycosyltransferase involved in cell wall biosynthesis
VEVNPRRVPLVSVCLLTYKRAAVLPRTIGDILGQTFQDFELVINDDRSPDDTQAICEHFATTDPRIRYFRNASNLRYAGNQNAAAARARGRYIAYLHDGDRYRPDLLQSWVNTLEQHPTAAIAFNSVALLNDQGEPGEVIGHGYPPLINGLSLYDEMLRSLGSPIFGIVMLRRDSLTEAGQFDTSFPVLADVDMWFRLLRHHDAAYVPEPLYAIYPREEDHPNRAINWKIKDELVSIYRQACDRRHAPKSAAWRKQRAHLERLFRGSDLRGIASCVKHRRFSDASIGLLALIAHWRTRWTVTSARNNAQAGLAT